MRPEDKQWIDDTSYEGLLRRWRFAPVGDPMFQGETGQYYKEVMSRKRSEVGPDAAVAASKNVGWD